MVARIGSYLKGNSLGLAAIFVALGGTAYAVDGPLAGQNTVGSEDIIGNEVKSDDIGNGRIFNVDIADDSIQGGKVRDVGLSGDDIATDSLGLRQIDEAQLGFVPGKMDFASITVGQGTTDYQWEHVQDRYSLRYTCPNPPSSNGTLTFVKESIPGMDVFADVGSSNPLYFDLPGGLPGSATVPAAATGEEVRFSYRTNSSNAAYGLVTVNVVHRADGCYLQSQGWLSR